MLPKFDRLKRQLLDNWHGVAIATLIAVAATFLSEHYGAPTMLFALMIGIGLHFIASEPSCEQGIQFSARTVLRFGVGLLGIQLGFENVAAVGLTSVSAVGGMLLLTLGSGVVLSFATGRKLAFGLLSAGSVAICGASAALALSAVLPESEEKEQDTLFVVIMVTMLSTIAMVFYPILCQLLGFSDLQSGFLLGATIHDVAQVIGAGYSISDEAGLIATFVKMTRVAALPLVVLAVLMTFRMSEGGRPTLPWFLVMFILLALFRNLIGLPEIVIVYVGEAARWMLVIAIAAIGLKTNLGCIFKVDRYYAAIICLETLFLLVIALIYTKMAF